MAEDGCEWKQSVREGGVDGGINMATANNT